MTALERLAHRCVLPGFEGTAPPEWVRRRAAGGLGGVALFARNVRSDEQVGELCAALHAESPALVIAIDEEGGDVTRLDARIGSRYPGNLALGVAGDPDLTHAVAAAMGARLASLGIGLNLAPVADVNTNPQNPIIGVRSFGSDPRSAAEHTVAWIEGMQGAGVAACAKHFPGHGDTSVDSHLALPVAREDPHVRALEPFRAAIAAGVRAIMSAHIVVPAIDRQPATISSTVMTGLLRGELGFEGVAVSDGLEMHALRGERSLGDSAVLALAAGCDLLCVGGGLCDEDAVDEIVRAILRAVAEGRLAEERIAEAAGRVEKLTTGPSGPLRPLRRLRRHLPTSGEEAIQLARLALRVDGDVRVGRAARVIRLESPSSIAAGEIPWGLAASLTSRGVHVGDEAGRMVIVARDLHRQPHNQAIAASLLAEQPDAILVEMGVPQCRPQGARSYIATHGSARVCADAAAEVMTRP